VSIEAHVLPGTQNDDGADDSDASDGSVDLGAANNDADGALDNTITDSDNDEDPHNLDMLKLHKTRKTNVEHKTRKTKKWQTRMMLEIIGASLVDTCLTCRHLLPRWRDRETTESNFMAFVRDLTPQIDARTEEQLDRDADESSSEVQPDLMSPVAEFTICARTSMGRNGVRSNGEKHTNQQRFKHCSARGRKDKHNHAWKTSWRCRAHPNAHTCKSKDRPCVTEHMAGIADLGN
jgi:hypothetical protein